MAFDTLWMNQIGDYIALENYVEINSKNVDSILALKQNTNTYFGYDNKNSPIAYELVKKIKLEKGIASETQFDKDVAFYDKIGYEIQFMILGLFCYTIYYALKKLRRKKRNPTLEDDTDWTEIGSTSKYNPDYDDWRRFRNIK